MNGVLLKKHNYLQSFFYFLDLNIMFLKIFFFSITNGIGSHLMLNIWYDLEKGQYVGRIYIATLL